MSLLPTPLEDLLCPEKANIIEALRIINKNSKGMVFVIDDHRRALGVLSDGDVRRGLLSGLDLTSPVSQAMRRDFVSATNDDDDKTIIAKFSQAIKIIPILNEKKEIVDYNEYHRELKIPVALPDLSGKELDYLTDAFISTWISSIGEYITRFEQGFADYCNVRHGVAVSNGTVALHLALVALGIGPGDEVIVPDLTFAATINAVLYTGATPVIVDVERSSWCIDPKEIKKAITKKTKAIIPVHVYGHACDMDPIMTLAKKHHLYVIEDAAEAHGATYKGRKVGSFGDINCFSFFANKIITTGEGGMCLTNSDELNEKMRVLRDHGMSKTKKYWHEQVGFNYRLTNLQAAIGVAQLERIDEIIARRADLERQYSELLSGIPVVEFEIDEPDRTRVTWLVAILFKAGDRDELISLLKAQGVDARPFFYSLSSMPVYAKYAFSNTVSRLLSKVGLNLPTSLQLNAVFKQKLIRVFTDYAKAHEK